MVSLSPSAIAAQRIGGMLSHPQADRNIDFVLVIDGGLSNIKIDALLLNLRGDARFGAMLKKMKLPG